MSLMLNTGVMCYREDGSSGWTPLTLVANADVEALAKEFSTSSTYIVGEYVRRGGLVYRCISPVTTAGAWDSTKWVEVNLGDEIAKARVNMVAPEEFYSESDIDDTNSIQKAINAAGSSGTVVFRADKTYTVSSTIYIDYANVKMISLASTMHKPVITAVPKSFSTSSTYAVGAYVTRNELVYRCISPVTTAGVWDSTKWVEVNLADETANNFTDSVMFYVRKHSVQFENLTIEGNYYTIGIKIYRENETAVLGVHIDSKVLCCYIRNHETGMLIYGRNCIIKDSNFSGCLKGAKFEFMPYNDGDTNTFARGWVVDTCRFHSMGKHWYGADTDLPSWTNINTVKNFDSWCVVTPEQGTENTPSRKSYSIIVKGNFLDGGGFAGLYYGGTENLELTNNLICRDNYNAILCYGIGGVMPSESGATSYKATGVIRDNVVQGRVGNYYAATETIGNICPIFLTGPNSAAEVEITNNTFINYSRWGVYLHNAVRTNIVGNVFDGVAFRTATSAIYNATSQDCIFASNFVNNKGSRTSINLINSITGFLTESCDNNVLISVTDNLSLPHFRTFSLEFDQTSIPANDGLTLTATNFSSIPSDYNIIAVRKISTGQKNIMVRGFDVSTGALYLNNMASSALTASPSCLVTLGKKLLF